MNAWKPILAALVIFAAGVITGGLTVRLARAPTLARTQPVQPVPLPGQLNVRGGRGDLLDRMQRELSLTPAQRERIDQILHDSQDRMKTLWDSISPQARAEHRRVRERIREELTSEQLKKYEEVFRPRGGKPGEGRRGESPRGDDPRKSDDRSRPPLDFNSRQN